jgi:hypothetical protein
MTDDEMANLLDSAADKIERDGWHQGDFYPGANGNFLEDPGSRPVCVRGALLSAQGASTEGDWAWAVHWKACAAVEDAISNPLPLVTWNDAPARTKQEVLDALRLAAKGERA